MRELIECNRRLSGDLSDHIRYFGSERFHYVFKDFQQRVGLPIRLKCAGAASAPDFAGGENVATVRALWPLQTAGLLVPHNGHEVRREHP
jgi:hypothetical protein